MNSRRDFFKKVSVLGTAGIAISPFTILNSYNGKKAPSDKLNLAFVGVGGRGNEALKVLSQNPSVNVFAFADVDDRRAAETYKMMPDVPHFRDFRIMLDKYGEQIDAVVIQTRHFPMVPGCLKLFPWELWH